MNTTFETPLKSHEVKSLNRVGLFPQNLPSNLDDCIRVFLWEKAEVDASPASSSTMIGGGLAAFGAGLGSALFREGGASLGTSFTTSNIKKQTSVQEWIHWKKYALDRPDFEQYREKLMENREKNYQAMVSYIRSDKGKECCDYEHWRNLARLVIVVISSFGSVFGWLLAWGISKLFESSYGITLPEWVIQKVLRKRSFASIRPRVGVNEQGLLELEY